MDNAIYATLTRQSGLTREMALIANNIANMSTTGYRREGTLFAEHVADLGGGEPFLGEPRGDLLRQALDILRLAHHAEDAMRAVPMARRSLRKASAAPSGRPANSACAPRGCRQ